MAFVVEDGSGLSTATSYISVDFFRDHHTDRGRTVDSGTYSNTLVQGAAVRATDYVDKRFGKKFRGFRESKAQALEWPRLSAFDNDDFLLAAEDEIPRQLQKAVAEYTLIILQIGELLPIPARPFATVNTTTGEVEGGQGGQVTLKREQVGPIEEETRYSSVSSKSSDTNRVASSTLVDMTKIPEYPEADLWLEELLNSANPRYLGRGD